MSTVKVAIVDRYFFLLKPFILNKAGFIFLFYFTSNLIIFLPLVDIKG
nr:MAG TPA: hypothetical protein [Caudoviricetes sp.]